MDQSRASDVGQGLTFSALASTVHEVRQEQSRHLDIIHNEAFLRGYANETVLPQPLHSRR